jgi:hypothetical protein
MLPQSSISMSQTFDDIPIAIPPADNTEFLSFSMPLELEVSLSMSVPDFG